MGGGGSVPRGGGEVSPISPELQHDLEKFSHHSGDHAPPSHHARHAPGTINATEVKPTSALDVFTDASYLASFHNWVTAPRHGILPLHAAILDDNKTLVRLLINNGAHISFKLPEDESLKVDMVHKIKKMGYEDVLLLSPTIWSSPEKTPYMLHDAAKRGDVVQLVESLIKKMNIWERDDTGNLPLYYSCLHGHAVCCSWIIIAMGGVHCIPPDEIERCVTNSLDARTKNLLRNKAEARDVIHRSIRVDESDLPRNVDNNLYSQLGEGEVMMGNLFGNEEG